MTEKGTRTRLKRTLTALAYASLILDIFIAVITSVGAIGIANLQALLIPVNYALTTVVILSAITFIAFIIVNYGQRRVSLGDGSDVMSEKGAEEA
jgi:hypothetical protein